MCCVCLAILTLQHRSHIIKQTVKEVFSITYRFATHEDCHQVYGLICELEGKQLPFERFCRIWEKQMNNSDYISLVCEESGILLGVLNLRFEDQLHHTALITEIMELSVKAELRSKGIGKALLQWAYQIAKEKGSLRIEASCNQLRVHAHQFYLREGMKNFHFKFTHNLLNNDPEENTLGQ